MDKVDQIRRAHNSSRPKTSNPAWLNCHHDCGFLLAEIERLRAVILDIARIVENPDDRALRRVRDMTDKESEATTCLTRP